MAEGYGICPRCKARPHSESSRVCTKCHEECFAGERQRQASRHIIKRTVFGKRDMTGSRGRIERPPHDSAPTMCARPPADIEYKRVQPSMPRIKWLERAEP